MQVFIKWLAIQSLVWGLTFAGGHYWLGEKPGRIVIGIDASFAMQADWHKVDNIIQTYANKHRYAEFALVTGKSRIHSWQKKPTPGSLVTFGPRRLDRIISSQRYPEIATADKRILITNATDIVFSGWEILAP